MNNNPKHKHVILTTVAVIILAAVALVVYINSSYLDTSGDALPGIFKKTAGQNAAKPPASGGAGISKILQTQVAYTDQGFSPATITIKTGDTVTFVNESSIGLWVASNPHPTHTDYPGFDEKSAIGNGDSWQFKFTRVGSFGYHNHLNPSVQGRIIVQ